ncbi:MAG: hypothetical protein WBP59_09300 [Ilumatobacteraceae bacterium]
MPSTTVTPSSTNEYIATDDVVLTREPGAPGTWRYLSTRPHPQLDPSGNPLASCMEAGTMGLVQLACQLDPDGDALERLRTVIGNAAPSRAIIVLQSAVERVVCISLRTVAASGCVHDSTELAHSTGSGYPPHTAVFNLSLRDADLAAARAAMQGERGHLEIEYRAETIHGPVTATADVGDWFSPTVQEDVPC